MSASSPETTADILALTDFSKKRSAWAIALNQVGASSAHLISLDEGGLSAQAKEETGLSDFGPDDFRPHYSALMTSLENEAHLSFLGRVMARQDVLVLLKNRLQIVDTFKRHPELEREEIKEPLFILGPARSGTSILHELLQQDERHRTLQTWEARYPCPPPEEATYATDPRIEETQREVMLWPRIVPDYEAMHEMGAQLPTECGDITANAFLGDRLPALHQVPSYAATAFAADMTPAYAIHKQILQILQWKVKRERWLLKAPAHMNWLPSLFAAYPDARVIQTHRDPLQFMGSTVSLISAILWMRTTQVDPEGVKLAFGPAYYEPQLYNVMQQRDDGTVPADQFFDVRFQDMMDSPFDTIRGVYANFGWDYTPEIERLMRVYLENKPKGKFGNHFYSFFDLGLDLETERARYAAYQERFNVPSEVVAL